jgi:predicted O-methyltransferase YrrM
MTTNDTLPTPVYGRDWTSHHFDDWKRWLGHLAGKPCHGLEIGSFEGRSARWFAETLLIHPHSSLMCVDPYDYGDEHSLIPTGGTWIDQQFDWSEIRRRFEHNLTPWLASGQVSLAVESSLQLLTDLPLTELFDWVYIDGSHIAACALEDSVLAWRRLKRGGVMIWDDYEFHQSKPHPDPVVVRPKFAIDAFLRIYNGQWQDREQSNDQVKIVRRATA